MDTPCQQLLCRLYNPQCGLIILAPVTYFHNLESRACYFNITQAILEQTLIRLTFVVRIT